MSERVILSLTVRQARMIGVVLSEMADVTLDDSVRRDCIQIGRRICVAIETQTKRRVSP